jgi:hypothetical protein
VPNEAALAACRAAAAQEKRSALQLPGAGDVIGNCSLTSHSLAINDNPLTAIRAVSDVAAANANAIERIANRLYGPNDNRDAYSFGTQRQAVADRMQLLEYYDASRRH